MLSRLEGVVETSNAGPDPFRVAHYVFATGAPERLSEEGVVITTSVDAAFQWKIAKLGEMAAACSFNLQTATCADGDLRASQAIADALDSMAGCQADPYDLSCAGQSEEEWLAAMESLMCPGGRSLELADLSCITALEPDWPYG
ncbi:hypothetical protein F4X86_02405 [Candidatus Saccharibacteria bacterium]|nr:hypothetical protein [Candidatus Saccharibacteria bacterium]